MSGFGRLIVGGEGSGQAEGRDGQCDRSQRAEKCAFHGELL
jgi:hypothetical protein